MEKTKKPFLIAFAGIVVLSMLAVMPAPVSAGTINVPGDYPTIQEAIHAAAIDDIVLVAPGTYYENIDFVGKAVTVRSTDPADPTVVASTIIHGGGTGKVVTFVSDEGSLSVLAGFTVTGGSTGIRIGTWDRKCSPTITNNTITRNADYAIYIHYSSPTITNNTIAGNTANAIHNTSYSSPTITNNIITGNAGKGIYNHQKSSPTITNNIITGNADYGIYSDNSSPTITNNTITGNEGCGVHNQNYSSPTITNNIITGNAGSGITKYSRSVPTINYNDVWGHNPDYDNCSAGQNDNSEPPLFANAFEFADMTTLPGTETTICVNKASLYEVGKYIEYSNDGVARLITYIENNEITFANDPLDSASEANKIVHYWAANHDVQEEDFHLQPTSPCIDAGWNEAPERPAADFDGSPRPVDGDGDGIETVDMGAFEYQVATNTPMECFKVNYMKVIDRTKHGAKRDKIKIAGSFKVAEDAFDSGDDVVTVAINDKVISIEESFKEKNFLWLHYYCFRGDIDDVSVHMHLNFDRCRWWVKIYGMEASDLVQSDEGATVELKIGENAGKDSFGWTKEWEGHKTGFAEFIEWSSIHCCGW